jgi:hypothetical protein
VSYLCEAVAKIAVYTESLKECDCDQEADIVQLVTYMTPFRSLETKPFLLACAWDFVREANH